MVIIFSQRDAQKTRPIGHRIRHHYQNQPRQGFGEINFFPLDRQGIKFVNAPLVHFEGIHQHGNQNAKYAELAVNDADLRRFDVNRSLDGYPEHAARGLHHHV